MAALLPGAPGRAALQDRWLASPALRAFDLGRVSPDAFAAAMVEEWGLALTPAAFLAEFAAWPRGYYPGARDLLRRLRRRHRVACLSNSNALHWERFGGFAEEFDVALSSHLLGAVKPDAAAFGRALDALGLTPGEVWFFDDSAANVRAARTLGILAFQVDGPAAAEAVLASAGLLGAPKPGS
jgi:putative hydrolase of the HAD superfamily